MPPLRRFGRPGLLGTAARTAVIAGTAQATTGAIQRRQMRRAEQRYDAEQAAPPPRQTPQQVSQQAPQYAQPAAPQGSGTAPDALLDQLTQLGELHAQGVLDDAEFAAAKAKLLG